MNTMGSALRKIDFFLNTKEMKEKLKGYEKKSQMQKKEDPVHT